MDSANILSILQTLGQSGSPANVLQGPAPGADAPDVQLPGVAQNNVMQVAAPPAPLPHPADVAQAAVAAAPPMPQQRRSSVLDVVGRIADVLARVGGAEPLYQSTLDAATARQTAASDHDLATQKAHLDLANSQTEAANSERERFASVLDAISDPEDAANMPAMMQAAGLTDPKYAPFIAMVQKDPNQAKVLAGALGGGSGETVKYGGQPIPAIGPDGKFTYVQANLTGGEGRNALPAGYTAVDPTKFINAGGQQIGYGQNTGIPKTIIPNTVSPNAALQAQTSSDNNKRTTQTQIQIAGMPARAKAPTAGSDGTTAYTEARAGLQNLSNQMDKIIGDPGLAHATGVLGSVERHLPGTPAQRVLGNIATLKGQSLVAAINQLKALSANGSLGFRLTQQEAQAFGNSIGGAFDNTNQSPQDYANNLRAAQGRVKDMISRLDAARNRATASPGAVPTGDPAAIAEARRRGLIH